MARGVKTGGRKKGTQNKINSDIKAMVLEALHLSGGVQYLVEQAQSNPSAFIGIVSKLVPKDINSKSEGNMNITILTGLPINEQSGY